jgi:hypothetical protein
MSGRSGSVVDGWYRTIALSTLPCYEDPVTETFDCFLPVLRPFPFHFFTILGFTILSFTILGFTILSFTILSFTILGVLYGVAVKGRLCCGYDGKMVDTCHVLFYLARRAGETFESMKAKEHESASRPAGLTQ